MDRCFTIAAIGHVESPLLQREAAPKQGEEGSPVARLVFDGTVRDGLRDLKVGDNLIVLTWLDRTDREVLRVHPRDDGTLPERGVFSTRSADRPNPIGLHRVKILSILNGLCFEVQNLEALHMTPIIDVKPVLQGVAEA
jgi:tRNA-Thr(GGU) m(6)t(6)A37 methyltransferase TsaA